MQRYDIRRDYQWNYDHPPAPDAGQPADPASTGFDETAAVGFCGLKLRSPLGIGAGPLLNAKWLVHYARLGFDFLTYKTVRTRYRECYPGPNLVFVDNAPVQPNEVRSTREEMQGSWAISFGMPSASPDKWMADVAWAKSQLATGQALSVSVVATPEPEWTLEQVAEDYATCAAWAVEAGADCVEVNFSCPNVCSADGQLYQNPSDAGYVAEKVRNRIGQATPLLVKIGHVTEAEVAEPLLLALSPWVSAMSMVNCIATRVSDDRQLLFAGESRGVGGIAIRDQVLKQICLFRRLIDVHNCEAAIVGIGGVSSSRDVVDFQAAGATLVHMATAAMLNPDIGLEIKRQLAASSS